MMRGGDELRYYPSPLKALLLLLAAGVFVVVGVAIVVSARGQLIPIIMGSVTIAFFGLGVPVSLVQLLGRVFHRGAWLTVDFSGIASDIYGRHQLVAWDQMGEIAIYRQKIPRSTSQYFLVVNMRDGDELSSGLSSRLNAAFFPAWRRAGMIVPLNTLFVRCTRAQCQRLLDRIRVRFGSQLAAYSITIDERERPMQ